MDVEERQPIFLHPLVVVIGASGAGKSAVTDRLGLPKVISFTTRGRRRGEVHGRNYYFLPEKHVEELKKAGKLAEWNVYLGHTYGVTKEELLQKSSIGPCYWVPDIAGLRAAKTFHPHVISIYLYTDREQTLQQLCERETSEEMVRERIGEYEESLTWMQECDYIVVNRYGQLEETVARVRRMIEIETRK